MMVNLRITVVAVRLPGCTAELMAVEVCVREEDGWGEKIFLRRRRKVKEKVRQCVNGD